VGLNANGHAARLAARPRAAFAVISRTAGVIRTLCQLIPLLYAGNSRRG
jgi:hypothetical protein